MSHITDVKLRVTDMEALAEACERLGLVLKEGQTTYRWYGQFVGDSEEGRRVAAERGAQTFGESVHAIEVKGDSRAYGIGLVPTIDGGKGFDLVYDSWLGGAGLEAKAGAGLATLRREYAAAVAMRKARAKLPGWKVERHDLASGAIRLKLRRR